MHMDLEGGSELRHESMIAVALACSKSPVVPGTGIEPVRPLCRKAADFKSAVSTNFTTRAVRRGPIVANFISSDSVPAL